MKSLVEEASSVVKAIEKAWNRAGCPQTFSVKVFEVPETNFFGFTKKSAKVGIFFEEEVAPQQKKYVSQNRDQRSQGTNRPQSKGRTDAPSYSREEKESDATSVESRRPQHAGRQSNQRSYERSSEPRHTSAQPVQKEAIVQRQEPVQHEDHQDRQPNRERQRPNSGRPPRNNDRNDRMRDEQPRQAKHEETLPFVDEARHEPRPEARREYEPRQEQEPRREREYEPRREREQDAREPRGDYEDNRREGGSRDRNQRSGDRRPSSRGGDRDRGGRNNRPERAQRHEFNEERPMFNNGPSEQSQPTNEQHQAPAHSAPEMASAPTSLAPQKKVLKVSGRRYSAPVKKTDE